MVEVFFYNDTEVPLHEGHTTNLIVATLQAEQHTLSAVSVSYVTEEAMRRLNRRYRGRNRSTDVLSWPFDATFPHGSGGELIIAPDVAARNATEHQRPLNDELGLLTVHGTLHLLGYEDETGQGAAVMAQRAAAILEAVHG